MHFHFIFRLAFKSRRRTHSCLFFKIPSQLPSSATTISVSYCAYRFFSLLFSLSGTGMVKYFYHWWGWRKRGIVIWCRGVPFRSYVDFESFIFALLPCAVAPFLLNAAAAAAVRYSHIYLFFSFVFCCLLCIPRFFGANSNGNWFPKADAADVLVFALEL